MKLLSVLLVILLVGCSGSNVTVHPTALNLSAEQCGGWSEVFSMYIYNGESNAPFVNYRTTITTTCKTGIKEKQTYDTHTGIVQ